MGIKQLHIKGRIVRLFRLIINTGYMLLYKKSDEIVLNVSMTLFCNKISHSNIGDDINYYLIKELSHKRILNYWDFFTLRSQPNFMVIGSIIDWMTNKDSIIWGSGVRNPDNPLPAIPHKVLAVRGPLTRKYLVSQGVECPEIYGDPALLLPKFYSPPIVDKKYSIGIILHKNDLGNSVIEEFIEREKKKVRQIDIKHYDDWRHVINEIVECEMIISSSLHGLILSDAYNIPNVWIKFSDETFDGSFKYLDYFASVKRAVDKPLVVQSRLDLADLLQYRNRYSPIIFNSQKLVSVCPFIDKTKFHLNVRER